MRKRNLYTKEYLLALYLEWLRETGAAHEEPDSHEELDIGGEG